jgi:hypothetical protein
MTTGFACDSGAATAPGDEDETDAISKVSLYDLGKRTLV